MRAHLLSSDDPLREGLTYFAICGAEVKNAIFAFMFRDDVYEFSQALSTLNTCPKCYEAQRFLTGRYIYGLVSMKKSSAPENDYENRAITA